MNKNLIFELLETMDNSINIIGQNINSNIGDMVNLFIDGFMCVNNNCSEMFDSYLFEVTERLSETLVELVEFVEKGKQEQIVNSFENKLVKEYYEWKTKINDIIKYNIIVYGINAFTEQLDDLFNYDRVRIIAIVKDSQQEFHIDNVDVILPAEIQNYNYDAIINLSEKFPENLFERSINLHQYYRYAFDYEFLHKYNKFLTEPKNYEGFITGLSYTAVGIDEKLLPKNLFDFAISSQDLFYDYKLAEYMLSFKEIRESAKYAIVGISNYSFQYDMSRSSRKIRTLLYRRICNSTHNYNEGHEYLEWFKSKTDLILKENFELIFYKALKKQIEEMLAKRYSTKFIVDNLSKEEYDKQAEEVKRTYDKNYPETVKENIEIFHKYMKLLKEHNIKPIVVVSPQNEEFIKHSSQRINEEFHEIIDMFKKEYNFQFIDGFNSKEFDCEDFYDIAHLNLYGKEKFTEILSKEIEW